MWIDALCIKQENGPEMNEEVRRMIDIYRHAQRTLVRLGPWPEPDRLPDFTPDWIQLLVQNVDSWYNIGVHGQDGKEIAAI